MTALTVSDVDLYYGAAQALRSVSAKAESGKITCVLGRNGVGKSSLLRAIMGHQPIRKGAIALDDETLQGAPHARAGRGLAYVPQGREIFPLLTVKENLETGYARLPRRERNVPADVFELFPVLKSMLSRRGGDLSGGQQQQLAIGRAMIGAPRLMLLDEPSEGIQPSIVQEIARNVKRLNAETGVAVLLVEQNLDLIVSMARRGFVIDKGRIVAKLGPEEIASREVVRKHLAL